MAKSESPSNSAFECVGWYWKRLIPTDFMAISRPYSGRVLAHQWAPMPEHPFLQAIHNFSYCLMQNQNLHRIVRANFPKLMQEKYICSSFLWEFKRSPLTRLLLKNPSKATKSAVILFQNRTRTVLRYPVERESCTNFNAVLTHGPSTQHHVENCL